MQRHLTDTLRWDDVRVFLAVARTGTLSAAAETLGVNASTVHRRVAAIEAELGVALFERAPRGYALTAVGEALVGSAEAVEEGVLALRRAATGHDRSASGPVTLTMPPSLVSVVAPCLARVCTVCPGLRPIVRSDDRVLDLGVEADLALRPSSAPPETAVGRRLGRIAWARYGRASDNSDDDARPWVIYAEGSGPAAVGAWWRRHHGESRVLMEVSSVDGMRRLLRATEAQGMLPCYVGDADPVLGRRGAIVEEAAIDLWLLIHADLRRSARVRAVVDLLVPGLEAARPLLEGDGPDPPPPEESSHQTQD